jgi:putative transposase
MNRKTPFAPGEIYHIYNRGVDKREIFSSHEEYVRFVYLLFLCNSDKKVDFKRVNKDKIFEHDRQETIIDISAWCLMPNHFHLLARAKSDVCITRFMEKVQTGYSMYFNKRHERSGSLFQGPFKAQHVDSDEYLKYLSAYIHLNPVKLVDGGWKESGIQDRSRAKKFLDEYRFSSYMDYKNIDRPEGKILSTASFPKYFDNGKNSFNTYINFWLDFADSVPTNKIPPPPVA